MQHSLLSPLLPYSSLFAPRSHHPNYLNTQALALGLTLFLKSSFLLWFWWVIPVECLLCHLYLHLPGAEALLWDLTVTSESKEILPSLSLPLPSPSPWSFPFQYHSLPEALPFRSVSKGCRKERVSLNLVIPIVCLLLCHCYCHCPSSYFHYPSLASCKSFLTSLYLQSYLSFLSAHPFSHLLIGYQEKKFASKENENLTCSVHLTLLVVLHRPQDTVPIQAPYSSTAIHPPLCPHTQQLPLGLFELPHVSCTEPFLKL